MKNKKYYIHYSVIFSFAFFFCIGVFLLRYHKSPLRYWDTFDMHYMEFIYFGKWVRNAIAQGSFPVWDHSIGYGADFFLTMSTFICDPVNWIAIFTPEGFAEIGFLAMVFLKFYLSGLAFSFLCFHRKHEDYAVLCGSLVYVFSACAYTGMYQSTFITPMYVLPLLIYGADKLFEKEYSLVYIITLTYISITSFYITYMLAILVVFYFLIKWLYRKNNLATFFMVLKRYILNTLVAAGMAAVVLVPIAIVMLNMGRLDLERYVPLFYDRSFYMNMFKGFIGTYDMQGRDCKIGFSVIALVSIVALLFFEKGYKKEKIVFLVMTLALCIPFIGHVMNGFGYVANRWIWAYALLLAYCVTIMIPLFKNYSLYQWIILLLCMCGYLFVSFEICDADINDYVILSIALVMFCLFGFVCSKLPDDQYKKLMVILSFISVFLPAYLQYSAKHTDAFSGFVKADRALSLTYDSGGLPLIPLVDAKPGTRYDRYGLNLVRNASWVYGISGLDFYMNIYNQYIDDFHNSIALNTEAYNFGYKGLDRRSELASLLGVKHFFTRSKRIIKPVGFDVYETETTGIEGEIQSWTIDKNNSIFTLFSDSVSRSAFDNLSPIERQQIMMKAVVIDGQEKENNVSKYLLDDCNVPYEIEISDEIKMDHSTLTAIENGSTMTLKFNPINDSEVYVYFDDIHFIHDLEGEYTVKVYGMNNGELIDNMSDSFVGMNNIHHMYGGKHNWLLNLGTTSVPVNEILVVFENAGQYTVNAINVFSRSIDSISENVFGLNHDIDSYNIKDNQIIVEVKNDEAQYLLMTVPYSKGWTAQDNGDSINIEVADIAFMTVYLQPGEHHIVFKYRTPGLIVGLSISIASIIVCIVMILFYKKKSS